MFLLKYFNCLTTPVAHVKLIPVKIHQRMKSFEIKALPNKTIEKKPLLIKNSH